jgi:Uma2 family endonuclease
MPSQTELQVPLPNVPLVETDGVPLESHWHVLQIALLIELLAYWFRDRDDYYAGGNMFLYYSEEQARNRDYRGPDFFYVDGANRLTMRRYWAVWQEGGRYPDLIIELLSPTTAAEDRGPKRTVRADLPHRGILLLRPGDGTARRLAAGAAASLPGHYSR